MKPVDPVLRLQQGSLPVPSGCIEWQKASCKLGYGYIGVHGKVKRTHRYAMEVHLGRSLSPAEHVIHTCDNPKCVNVQHLRVGTHADNMQDKAAKGRVNGQRINSQQSADLYERYQNGERFCSLAEEYGVNMECVWASVHRYARRHGLPVRKSYSHTRSIISIQRTQ